MPTELGFQKKIEIVIKKNTTHCNKWALFGLNPYSPEDRSPQMVQMCLLSDSDVPEGCAGTFIMPLMPNGGLISSVLLTEFIGEFSWNVETQTHTWTGHKTAPIS